MKEIFWASDVNVISHYLTVENLLMCRDPSSNLIRKQFRLKSDFSHNFNTDSKRGGKTPGYQTTAELDKSFCPLEVE